MSDKVRERGIIMQGESVRAIIAGRKTQTRRVATQLHANACRVAVARESGLWCSWEKCYADAPPTPLDYDIRCPYGAPGDRLWVKEAWTRWCSDDGCDKRGHIAYRADASAEVERVTSWRSPMFMPRWASRITLEITEVRVQRVQEISEDDARAEGCHWSAGAREFGQDREAPFTARDDFAAAWDAINAKRGFPWASNPFVWVVEFKVLNAR